MPNSLPPIISTSHHPQHCDGYGNPGTIGNGYYIAPILEVAAVANELGHEGSKILDETNAFDQAEAKGAYIGQINMITVSSFCGPEGRIWGYDVCKHPDCGTKHPLMPESYEYKNSSINILSIEPLIDSAKSLFGTADHRRFPLKPGSHVPCATKSKFSSGLSHIYSAMAIGIPEDRSANACLLMEDLGTFNLNTPNFDIEANRRLVLENLVKSVIVVGYNQRYKFQSVFVGVKDVYIKENEVGCAILAAPYFSLAQKAVPESDINLLPNLSLSQWEELVKKDFLG